MRKPVHVETGIWQTDSGEIANVRYSFCNDGTMWELREDVWRRLPDIPQDEPEQIGECSDVVAALQNLAEAEEEYRRVHGDAQGIHDHDGWMSCVQMRKAGDAARAILKRIDEKDEPQ